MARIRLDDPCYYFNRHESWMAFNRRVLEETQDEGVNMLRTIEDLLGMPQGRRCALSNQAHWA
jgi:polyphosphate kinase